jgi:hypothetical protein
MPDNTFVSTATHCPRLMQPAANVGGRICCPKATAVPGGNETPTNCRRERIIRSIGPAVIGVGVLVKSDKRAKTAISSASRRFDRGFFGKLSSQSLVGEQPLKIVDRLSQALLKGDARLPAK